MHLLTSLPRCSVWQGQPRSQRDGGREGLALHSLSSREEMTMPCEDCQDEFSDLTSELAEVRGDLRVAEERAAELETALDAAIDALREAASTTDTAAHDAARVR